MVKLNYKLHKEGSILKRVINHFIFVASVFVLFFIGASISFAESKWDQSDVPLNKTWTILFNAEIMAFAHDDIYVEDSLGNKLDVNRYIDGNKIIVEPPKGGYEPGAEYHLHIKNATSIFEQELKEKVDMKFSVAKAINDGDDEISIPDANLEKVVRETIVKPTGKITESDMLDIFSLNARKKNIEDLSGLEYARNLKTLELGENYKISDITPLSGLTKLEKLELDENILDDKDLVNLETLINLKYLDLDSNKLSDIKSISKLINLEWLDLYDNLVSDLSPLSKLTKLNVLNISYNLIEDVQPLSNLSQLEYLNISRNEIINMEFISGLQNIKLLFMGGTLIGDINGLIALNNLSVLDLNYTALNSKSTDIINTLKSKGIVVIQNKPPQAPTGVQANVVTNNNSIQIKWNKVENAQYYHVYYSHSPNEGYTFFENKDGSKMEIKWNGDKGAVLNNNPSGTTLYFKVTAVLGGVESDYSEIISATIPSNVMDNIQTKYDSFEDITWYYDKDAIEANYSSYVYYNDDGGLVYPAYDGIHLYMGKRLNQDPFLRFVIHTDNGSDYLNVTEYIIQTDTNKYTIRPVRNEMEQRYEVWSFYHNIYHHYIEYYDKVVENNTTLNMIRDIANSNEVRFRVKGINSQYDGTLKDEHIQSIKNILDAYDYLLTR